MVNSPCIVVVHACAGHESISLSNPWHNRLLAATNKKVLAKVDSSKNSFLNFHFIRLAKNIVAKTASGVKLLGVNYPTLFQPYVALKHTVEFQ